MSRNDSFNKTWASAPAQFERPGDGLVARGWAGGASEDPPEAKWENWWHNRVDEALKELQNLGQLIWFADAPYQAGARVNHGSNRYIALEENTGVEPTGALDIGVWQKEDINLYLKTTNNLSEIAAAGPNAVLAAITNLNLLTTVNNANGALQVTRNLSDLNDAAAARTNLGLGGASSLNVGTTAGTVAAGNDSRIVGALQSNSNLSDVPNKPAARGNLGLGNSSVLNTANNAEMAAGSSTILVPTVAAVMSLFSKREFGGNNFIRIPDVPGGLIVQWGYATGLATGTAFSPISFPIAFPVNPFLIVTQRAFGSAAAGTQANPTVNNAVSQSGFSLNIADVTSVNAYWLAIGY